MKTLRNFALAALLATTALAQAATWSTPNKAGGKIILTDRPCAVPEAAPLYEAYSYSSTGARQDGCWGTWDGLVQIVWETGRRSAFDNDTFTADEPVKRPVSPARRKNNLEL